VAREQWRVSKCVSRATLLFEVRFRFARTPQLIALPPLKSAEGDLKSSELARPEAPLLTVSGLSVETWEHSQHYGVAQPDGSLVPAFLTSRLEAPRVATDGAFILDGPPHGALGAKREGITRPQRCLPSSRPYSFGPTGLNAVAERAPTRILQAKRI